jgi:hypothetical protein
MNTHIRDNLKAIGDPWTSYTATWSSTGGSPAIGSGGSVAGAWMSAGKLVHFRITHTWGGAGLNVGTGIYQWLLPSTAFASRIWLGGVVSYDSSGSVVDVGHCFANTTTSVGGLIAAGTRISATSPYSWANGDTIILSGTYESA